MPWGTTPRSPKETNYLYGESNDVLMLKQALHIY